MQAVDISSANLFTENECGNLLKYKGAVIKVTYVEYKQGENRYPAYCLDKTKPGVTSDNSYSVSVQEAISDVKLWRIITNGYPYKTIQELGCSNREEAFTATKQAVYCYIHGNNPSDYEAIGTAGQRTLNALNKILRDSQNSQETQISNTVKVIRESDQFTIDKMNKNYVSKTYSVSAGTTITNYKVKLTSDTGILPEEIKVTDLNNNEKSEFAQNEKFKILIPIKNLTKEGKFKINIETKINNKPVLYGKAPNSSYQDYALTAATYENATGKAEENYYKNETKIKIIKRDKKTQKRLEGVEFNILNDKKEVVYANLKTNSNGEIELQNLIPGKYYIKETSEIDGYVKSDELIEANINLNESLTITINNEFQEKAEIKIENKKIESTVENTKNTESSKEISVTETTEENSKKVTVIKENTEAEVTTVKKLPVTGM